MILTLISIGLLCGIGLFYLYSKYYDQIKYKRKLAKLLQQEYNLRQINDRCIMNDNVVDNLKCLREQQLNDYRDEYHLVKVLSQHDIEGYLELQKCTIIISEFFTTYATMFDKNVNEILLGMMLSDSPTQGGNVGKNIDYLREMLIPVTDFSEFKIGDKRPNHREMTQMIVCNSHKWCKFMWFMVVGLVKKNDKIKEFIAKCDVNVNNLNLRIKAIQTYLIDDIDHIISGLCDVSDINSGIPENGCSKGPMGRNDLKCDIFCEGKATACTLIYKVFSFNKAMGKSITPEQELAYDKGYGEFKPEQFKKLRVDGLLPPPSSRELAFWNKNPEWNNKEYVPWSNGMHVILTNPGNPLADLSNKREDLSVAGTSGHAESILSIATLFNRYKNPQNLKNLVRGLIVSICPHHHSIREIATAAYPPPYNIDFNFNGKGPLDIVQNLL